MTVSHTLAQLPAQPAAARARFSRGFRALAVAGWAWLALLMGPLAAAAEAEAEEQSATELVRGTTDEVLALIEEARSYAEENPERFYREVEALLSPVVDFDGFARSVMATYYRDATPEQRQRFAETFKWGLVRTYALALLEFEDDGNIRVIPPERPSRNPRRQTVTMEIRTDAGEVYPVVYSMAQNKAGEWKVRNLIVNGVNMGLTYRNQFASAMRDPQYDGELDQVIDAWDELLRAEAPGLEGEQGAASPGAKDASGGEG